MHTEPETQVPKQYYVRWGCPTCGNTFGGYISADDHRTRYCPGIPITEHESGERCGKVAKIIHDERPNNRMDAYAAA
jgi:hypothetical protein